MQIHESAEDYLEKILMLKEAKGVVRSIDIANAMGFSKPSISIAMKHLRENGYIVMDEDNYISPTPDLTFAAGDILWIVGNPKQLARLK